MALKKYWAAALAMGGCLGWAAADPANAVPITSPLNCTIISGTTSCPTTTGTYGSLTFDQVTANTVSIVVALTSPATMQDLFLNLANAFIPDSFTAVIGTTNIAVSTGSNAFIPNGAGNPANEAFDLTLPVNPPGPATLTSFGSTFTILLTDTTKAITPTDIIGQFTTGGLDAALHLQNCTGIGVCSSSLVVGENVVPGGGGGGGTPAPEPESLALLGAGLVGLSIMRSLYARRS